jgi:two-component system, chemotaxis family, protein-glutamate methylesterase/glutaminase
VYTVIVIDDSPIMRDLLSEMVNSTGDFKVIATAGDAFEGRDKIKEFDPDLVTIDINMPKMDGVSFLKNIMRLRPMPAVVISSEGYRGSEVFEDGAIGFIPKPESGESMDSFRKRVVSTLMSLTYFIKRYAAKKPSAAQKPPADPEQIEQRNLPDVILPKKPAMMPGKKLIAIGSSTGGIETLMEIFSNLPSGLPPIVMTQHIPYGFSRSFAERLDRCSQITVHEAVDGQKLERSHAYLAPGHMHMLIEKTLNGEYIVKLNDGPRVSRHKPSVDVLFRSVNNCAGGSVLAIMLTGMGDDGASCMKELFDNRAYTIAQDEASCVVYGMPAKAVEYGGVREVVQLKHIPAKITEFGLGK